jgi:serine/threonine protein kinase
MPRTDPLLGRKVALKLIHADHGKGPQSDELRARLLREARAIARLSHPNVITVPEIGLHGDLPFVAMELVEGTTLRSWLAASPRPWRDIVAVFIDAGVAGDLESHVEDHHDRLTRTGMLLGTPGYIAPEALRGGAAEFASDQFSFCVALHEGLFGECPSRHASSTPGAQPSSPRRGSPGPGPAMLVRCRRGCGERCSAACASAPSETPERCADRAPPPRGVARPPARSHAPDLRLRPARRDLPDRERGDRAPGQ